MYVSYSEMPENSRVWVYQASRSLSASEQKIISDNCVLFLEQWTKHGSDLKASFTLDYNQFLTLVVDESFMGVSGCSIDASVRFVKELGKVLEVDFMDKMKIAVKEEGNIVLYSMKTFKDAIVENQINSKAIVFNNLVQTKKAKIDQWEVVAADSWHKRYFN